MELEQQVVSFENAKRLKELNIRKESLFYWCEFKDKYCIPIKTKPYIIYGKRKWKKELLISAFTVAELGEILPTYLKEHAKKGISFSVETDGFCIFKRHFGWIVSYAQFSRSDKTLANAMAQMLILLIENKLYDPQNTQKTQTTV